MFEWVSVKDRLPEENQRCLVCIGDPEKLTWVDVAYFYPNLEEFSPAEFMGLDRPGFVQFNSRRYLYYEVTVYYWSPIPETPRIIDFIKDQRKEGES